MVGSRDGGAVCFMRFSSTTADDYAFVFGCAQMTFATLSALEMGFANRARSRVSRVLRVI